MVNLQFGAAIAYKVNIAALILQFRQLPLYTWDWFSKFCLMTLFSFVLVFPHYYIILVPYLLFVSRLNLDVLVNRWRWETIALRKHFTFLVYQVLTLPTIYQLTLTLCVIIKKSCTFVLNVVHSIQNGILFPLDNADSHLTVF